MTPSKEPTSKIVLKELQEAHAFREIRDLLAPRELVETKLAEVCAEYLTRFRDDLENRDAADILRKRRGDFSKASRLLRGAPPARAEARRAMRAAGRGVALAFRAAGIVTRRRLLKVDVHGELAVETLPTPRSTARIQRDAMLINTLTVDLTLVLRRTTKMSLSRTLVMAVPPILKTLSRSYEQIVPKRGFSEPEVRFKRFVRNTLRTVRPHEPKVTKATLLQRRERLLFSRDPRFKSHPDPSQL